MGKKVIDESKAYNILSSNAPKDSKLRQLSQLQYGNRKLGTMGAKQMYTNYLNKKQTRGQESNPFQSMTPEQQQQLNDLVSMLTKPAPSVEKEKEEEIDMDAISSSII